MFARTFPRNGSDQRKSEIDGLIVREPVAARKLVIPRRSHQAGNLDRRRFQTGMGFLFTIGSRVSFFLQQFVQNLNRAGDAEQGIAHLLPLAIEQFEVMLSSIVFLTQLGKFFFHNV